MNENLRLSLRLIAFLLQYPDDGVSSRLPDAAAMVETLPAGEIRVQLAEGVARLRSLPLIRLQESYTRAFDMTPATSLNLTFHRLGESDRRGSAMAELAGIYAEAGYEPIPGELPDHLPMMVEFLSVCKDPRNAECVAAYMVETPLIARALAHDDHPYAPLFGALCGLLNISAPEGQGPMGNHDRRKTP
jgi:nitrate reductase delta subunit